MNKTTINVSLNSADSLIESLAKRIEGLEIEATDRKRLAAGCFHQALEHHEAIVYLFRRNLCGSAMALVRPMFEVYIRGIWLANCASDLEFAKFKKGKIDKTFGELIAAIEANEGYNIGVLGNVKANSWSAMNEFTHGGMLQISRRNSSDAITSNYSLAEIEEAITFSGAIGLLSTSEVAIVAGREDLALSILEDMKSYSGRH